jgi:hypothetical protein
MGPPALLPIRKEGVLRIFISLTNPSPWPVSSGKHTNHYTTKATFRVVTNSLPAAFVLCCGFRAKRDPLYMEKLIYEPIQHG